MRRWLGLLALTVVVPLTSPAYAQSAPAGAGSPAAAGDPDWSPALERKCTSGDARACMNMAVAIDHGRGTTPDPVRAYAAFIKACTGNIAYACAIAGSMRSLGKPGITVDRAAGYALFKRGCDLGSPRACREATAFATGARGMPRDDGAFTRYGTRGCQLNDSESCRMIADFARINGGPSNRPAASAALQAPASRVATPLPSVTAAQSSVQWPSWNAALDARCNAGDTRACLQAGAAQEHGRGVARNPARAYALYQLGCHPNSGLAEACWEAAAFAEGSRGLPSDRQIGRYLAYACIYRKLDACIKLGNMAARAKYYDDAVKWYGDACALGNQPSCTAKREMERFSPKVAAAAAAEQARRAAITAAQTAETSAIDQWITNGNIHAAIHKVYNMSNSELANRVISRAHTMGAMGGISDTYLNAFARWPWQLSAETRQYVNAEIEARARHRIANTPYVAPVDTRFDGVGPGGPSLADQAADGLRRRNAENCAAAREGRNRVCNRN